MGGTSFDVALIAGGRSVLSPQTSIDFGLVIRQPMIEIATIGAGGGSIAWVDAGGLLNIGPKSAGSDPGPVAYGRGNDRPTVTDANVVLGRINADSPIGGQARLDVEAARAAIAARVGAPLGLTVEAAAEAILAVANSRMAGAIRLVSIERGFDPTRFAFLPFGGGGALHACALMRDVGLSRAIVPRYPGVTSALGCVIADMRHDFVQTVNTTLDAADPQALATLVQSHADEGDRLLDAARSSFAGRDVTVELDMAYAGQTHTVAVPLVLGMDGDRVRPPTRDDIAAAFDVAYRASFGRLLKGGLRRIVNLRTAVTGRRPKFDLLALAPPEGGSVDGARRGTRAVHFGDAWAETAIYDRLSLPVGARIAGPAILAQPDTTILIEPGHAGEVDRFGNVLITRETP